MPNIFKLGSFMHTTTFLLEGIWDAKAFGSYKWVRKCEIYLRPRRRRPPLRPLPIPSVVWRSVSMEIGFVLPLDEKGRNGVLFFADVFSKMVHFVPVPAGIIA
ncbi:Inositol-3-phosphate synthase [Phytophthora megakarya]|uniref:Inositol-3-phosphate synthase n=1 Tax=Phytophthora megakarya TaxID=4795 RepID=A0A225W7B4_9STRA|nr:Inositol-3-phosphate synthase [Phytophthora megakarya]